MRYDIVDVGHMQWPLTELGYYPSQDMYLVGDALGQVGGVTGELRDATYWWWDLYNDVPMWSGAAPKKVPARVCVLCLPIRLFGPVVSQEPPLIDLGQEDLGQEELRPRSLNYGRQRPVRVAFSGHQRCWYKWEER